MESNMPNMLPPAGVVAPPKSGAPKVLGLLNIIFGAALLLCGLCSVVSVMTQIAMAPMLTAAQQQMQQRVKDQQEAERTEQLRILNEQEQAATTEEEKQKIQNQRQGVQTAPTVVMPVMPDMTKMYGMNDPHVLAYFLTDILSSVLMNSFLVISGVGLVGMKEWGRKLAIWVAAIKIGRLFVSQFYNIVVVVPVWVKQMTEVMEQMMTQMPPGPGGGPPPGFGSQLATIYGIMFTVAAVGTLVIGSIYPGILLWMLTRSDAKAACRPS